MKKRGMRKALSQEQASELRLKWNVCEWDKPEQYAYVRKLEGDRLRWEFVRRDPDYRIKAVKSKPNSIHPILGPYKNPQIRGDDLAIDFSFWDTARRGRPLLLEPPKIKTLLFTREEMTADHKIREHYAYRLEELYELGHVVMAFDPTRAITPQINAAKKILTDYYKEHLAEYPEHTVKGKRSPKDASKLLRALDAALVGINNQIIGSDIFGVEKYDHQHIIGQERLQTAQQYWRVM